MEEGMMNELQKKQLEQRIRERGDAQLSELIDTLPYNPRRVIELRYGLADGHRYSVQETADVFAKPANWVVGMESNALSQLYELYRRPRGRFCD